MKTPIIEAIIKTSELIKDCKLEIAAIENNEHMLQLNKYFKTSTIETIILTTIFQLSAENKRIDRDDMAQFLGCNPILLFKYEENFKRLYKTGFLENDSRFLRKIQYQLSDTLHEAIICNNTPEIDPCIKKTDPIEILIEIVQAIDDRYINDAKTSLLINEFNRYIAEYEDVAFIKALDKLELSNTDKLAWLLLIERKLNGANSLQVETLGDYVFLKNWERIKFSNSLHDKSNTLMSQNWIDFAAGGFMNNARVALTLKSKEFLKALGINLRMDDNKQNEQLINPENTHRKKLYFNPAETEQIETVRKSLKIRNHAKIKKRLQKQGLRTGICTLLYGAPGTGKTESVYQIAKETGRSLWKVDLTELKSMWYGESQKKVKILFTNYKDLCKDEKRTPILLLNEADAILGTRQTTATSGSGSADNAIQNIFLDCLEDFEGILFATTNLEASLDTAFERRFLFKIKFERPEADAQQQIWKAMLKELTILQSKTLSRTYNLSGGEIENVLRKLAMKRVLQAEIDVFETLKILCENEKLGLKARSAPIGYFK
ncbi:ATP-binding protein [Aequorivita marina]|uniref:ATP-binding protein n=1 Tax=Aequorivita marina TaxID=3073654 RepID=UPI0028744532|nr:AAA family ATPase [Aequorivita sp. S2608]MDS1297324.1 AAA family ATPase [Aequorivita sp. S2608]